MARPLRIGANPAGRRERGLQQQFLLFCLVGMGNALVDAGVYTALIVLLGWSGDPQAVVASVLGFLAGATHSFLWNSRVTFRNRWFGVPPRWRFAAVVAGGAAIAAAVSVLALAVWPFAGRLAVAKIAAMAATLGWNFSLSRAWVFTPRRP
ncbi:MAG: GtrA family protein [Dehalococcoidia bacterium]